MRAPLLVALLLALPLAAAAAPPEEPGACTNAGCVRTADTDGDGSLDWASVGSGGEPYGVNVVWRGGEHGEVWWEAIAHTDDHEESYYAVWTSGHAHLAEEHRHVDGCVALLEASAPTGDAEDLAWVCAGVAAPHDAHLPHPHLP